MIQPRLHARLHARLQVIHDAIPKDAVIGICNIRIEEAGDEAISQSHKCMELTPLNGS